VISTDQLSLVFQGPLVDDGWTLDALRKAQALFPGAEIILSTWMDADLPDFEGIKVVLSSDPGGVPYPSTWGLPSRTTNNLSRQLVSTQAGLAVASRPYAAKIRTDFRFTSSHILEVYAHLETVPPDSPRVFRQRVAVPVEYCPNPRRLPLLFHPSDLFCFGLTADLRDFFGAPLPAEPAFTHWFAQQRRPHFHFLAETHRYTPEQYLWINCLRKKFPAVRFEHACDAGFTKVLDSERFFWGNFMPVPLKEIGLESQKDFRHVRTANRLHRSDGYATWLKLNASGSLIRKAFLHLQYFCALITYAWLLTPSVRRRMKTSRLFNWLQSRRGPRH
jgi:hypothetical protein